MTLIENNFESFITEQRRRVQAEIDHWDEFRRNSFEGAFLAFSEQRREGQLHVRDNRLQPEREETLREYVTLPDVVEVDGILVDMSSLYTPYNCMWKSCRLTGKYCCKITSCTANTDFSKSIMREAGRHFIDRYSDEKRITAIRKGNTHTKKLDHNRRIDGHCVFGEEQYDDSPDGESHPHIHCHLHEAAYDNDVPLHYLHSIGPSLFPADILILDGQWFITAASKRAKDKRVTRWWVTSDETICTNHGDSSGLGILQHPDYDAMYADILGRSVVDNIQKEVYGSPGAVEPEIQDGWIHAAERGLEAYESTCRNCEGEGCSTCDGRGYFRNWRKL